MKKYLAIMGIYGLASCGNEQDGKSVTDRSLEVATGVSTEHTDTLCFIRTEGTRQQDTAFVRLIIHNEHVTGTLMVVPSEKDARRGALEGSRRGDEINGNWTYEQEGILETIRVSFRISGEELLQQATVFDPTNGKEILPDTASYSIVYRKADCRSFSEQAGKRLTAGSMD